jgi:hypothetical protein
MAFESLILDARGNPYQGALDAIGGDNLTDARTTSFSLGSVNAEVLVDLHGKSTFAFDARTAAGALTYVCEGTIDGTNYMALPMFANFQLLVAAAVAEQYVPSVVIATTHSGIYNVPCAGFRRLRIRVSAYTSGAVTITPRATEGQFSQFARPIPATLHVTVTAAAAAAATITLPAAGAGMFHYITYLECKRNATAALAGTATLIVTSTNLPGTPAWSNGNAMVAGGDHVDVFINGSNPLKSLVANTATTIVMPAAGAAVLNRGNCSYYVGA